MNQLKFRGQYPEEYQRPHPADVQYFSTLRHGDTTRQTWPEDLERVRSHSPEVLLRRSDCRPGLSAF